MPVWAQHKGPQHTCPYGHNTHASTHARTHARACMHSHARTHRHVCMHSHTHLHARTQHADMHVYTHVYIRTDVGTCCSRARWLAAAEGRWHANTATDSHAATDCRHSDIQTQAHMGTRRHGHAPAAALPALAAADRTGSGRPSTAPCWSGSAWRSPHASSPARCFPPHRPPATVTVKHEGAPPL